MSATMPPSVPVPGTNRADNLSHNVVARIEQAQERLSDLATLYLMTEVAGYSPATLDAKRRDLLMQRLQRLEHEVEELRMRGRSSHAEP